MKARVFFIVLGISWPFLIYAFVQHQLSHQWLWYVFALLCIGTVVRSKYRTNWYDMLPIAGMTLLTLLGALFHQTTFLFYYPVCVNALMLCIFGASLFSDMPVIERFARLTTSHLSAFAIAYTRKVTQVWCLFFIINGGIAFVTCLHGDVALWTLWNGVISYVCIGILMTGEYGLRLWLRKKYDAG